MAQLLTGSLYLVISTPWAAGDLFRHPLCACLWLILSSTGDTYDATTTLMQALLRRIEGDIDELNYQRAALHKPAYPMLEKAWLLSASLGGSSQS